MLVICPVYQYRESYRKYRKCIQVPEAVRGRSHALIQHALCVATTGLGHLSGGRSVITLKALICLVDVSVFSLQSNPFSFLKMILNFSFNEKLIVNVNLQQERAKFMSWKTDKLPVTFLK